MRIRSGEPLPERYAYGERPVREEVIREHRGGDGSISVAVTRNVYGALVLNTARVMFVDVDVPDPGRIQRIGRWLKQVFRRGRAQAAPDPIETALARLHGWVASHPRYRALCRVQQSFRARLTPKPWRCGIELPPARYPYEHEDEQRGMAAWEARYASACEAWATCAFMQSVGSTDMHPEVEPVQRLHDEMTRVSSELPLS